MGETASDQGVETSGWISANEALEALFPHHGGWLNTKLLLADRLVDGWLQARAKRLWTSDAPSITAAWQNREDAETEQDVEVGPSVWRSSRFWLDDVAMWRWPDNRFVITKSKSPSHRIFIEGVQFDRERVWSCYRGKAGRVSVAD